MFKPVLKTVGGSGGGAPGPAGKSAYQLAVQQGYVGTLEEWLVSLEGEPGTDGDDGKSVELQKSETAIQWRQVGGAFTDLVTLEEIKGAPGDPGADIIDHAASGYIDIGNMRMAWGTADSIIGTPETFAFPAPFAVPPTVVVTRTSPGSVLVAREVTTSGFVIDRADLNANPIPFTWTATGLNPDAVAPPSNRFDVPGLPTWSAAVRAQRAGKRNARILCLGDSTTAGYGAFSTTMTANDKAGSYPTALCDLLTARGSYASWSSVNGTNGATNTAQYDTRCTFGAGWQLLNTAVNTTMAGYTIFGVNTANKFNFTPTNQCDTFELYSLQRQTSGNASFTLSVNNVDKSVITTISDNSSPGYFVKTTVTHTLGNNVFGFKPTTVDSSEVHFGGIVGYNSAIKEITVLNGGWSGAKVGDFNNGQTGAWSPLRSIALYNPDLVIINLGINDWGQASPTARAVWMGHMQAIVDACRASGADILLVVPNEIGGVYNSAFLGRAWYVADLAIRNGIRWIDVRDKIGNFAAANAAGFMKDDWHPNASGYAKIAEAIADVIMPVS